MMLRESNFSMSSWMTRWLELHPEFAGHYNQARWLFGSFLLAIGLKFTSFINRFVWRTILSALAVQRSTDVQKNGRRHWSFARTASTPFARFVIKRRVRWGTVLIFYSTHRPPIRYWDTWSKRGSAEELIGPPENDRDPIRTPFASFSMATTRASLCCRGGRTAECPKIPSLSGWTEPMWPSPPSWPMATAALCTFLRKEMLQAEHSVPWLGFHFSNLVWCVSCKFFFWEIKFCLMILSMSLLKVGSACCTALRRASKKTAVWDDNLREHCGVNMTTQ